MSLRIESHRGMWMMHKLVSYLHVQILIIILKGIVKNW